MPGSANFVVFLFLAFASLPNAYIISPAHRYLRSRNALKRQNTATSSQSIPSTTTLYSPSGFTQSASLCVCRLVTPFNQYTTVTSYYTPSGSFIGTATTTLDQPTGPTPGTIEILSPVSFVTSTSYYVPTDGTETIVTTTVAQARGSVPGTVVVEYPESFSTTTEYTALAFTTGTTTIIEPSGTSAGFVEVIAPTNVASCTNAGIEYSIYYNPFYNNVPAGPGYPNYVVTYFESTQAEYQGVTYYVGYHLPDTNQPVQIYSDTQETFSEHNFTIIHEAYLFTRLEGTYTWTSSFANDITLLWVGDTALTCSSRGTAFIDQTYEASQNAQSYSATFSAGQYVPFKIQSGQSLGSAQLNMIIHGPDGRQLLNSTGSQDVLLKACNTSLPSFTPCSGYKTTTLYGAYPSSSTSTIADPSGTASGTIDVFIPRSLDYSTSTTQYTGTNVITSTATSTISPSGTTPGTIVLVDPNYGVTTVTSGTTGATYVIQTATGTMTGVVEVAIPTPDLDCGNHGIEYGIFTNPYTRGLQSADPTYSEFQAEAFHTEQPQATGITNYMGLPFVERGTEAPIYDQPPQYWNLEAVNHRTYLFAKLSGNFTFDFPLSDDITLLWVGSDVYGPAYTRQNANLEQLYNGGEPISQQTRYTYNITLQQGQYVPIRVLYANAQYDADFQFNIYAPDGELVTNSSTQFTFSPYVVRFSCDNVTAPPFAAWGTDQQ